ncbi:MAG: acetate--CoA ligase family protein, partial [Chloroflexi bacterium]|nr:acetate--CoA ligase family protein [Chloroflexota bacterium]
GRSAAGARATSTHTGAMLAASDVTVEALFRQAGVIRTDTMEEMFGVASLLANQPVPGGPRVGIVSNAGGPAILAADACEAQKLLVPPLAEETRTRLRALLPPEASVANPVDMIATATAEQYREAIGLLAGDANIDAVIAIFIQPFVTRASDVAQAVLAAARALDGAKPVLAVLMSAEAGRTLQTAEVSVPWYAFPESAVIALAHAVRYGEWRQKPAEAPSRLEGLGREGARAIVAGALARGGGWLEPQEVEALLSAYGLRLPAQRVASGPDEAGTCAEALGGQIALKAIAPDLVHKSEAGAVRLGLQGLAAVRGAAAEMVASLTARGHPLRGFLVQQMVPPGVEMIAGIVNDRLFGPVVACGAGGVLVELLGDVAVRLAPLTEADAREMVRSLKSYPLLTGYRGAPERDIAGLEDVLLRISTLAEDLPEVAELDCNPVIVLEAGAVVADARVRVEPAEPIDRAHPGR